MEGHPYIDFILKTLSCVYISIAMNIEIKEAVKPVPKKRTTMKIQGTLITITEFYQIVIELTNPEDISFLEAEYENQKLPDDHTYVKITVNNWDRNSRNMMKMDSRVGETVIALVTIKPYSFVDKESEENIQGVCLTLNKLL